MPMPTKRTPEVVEAILERIARGEPLAAICRSEKRFPDPSAWLNWVRDDETLAIAYQNARDRGADALAEECLQIADDSGFDAEIVTDAQGRQKVQINGEAVNRARLRVDTRLKLLAKWNPKRYGDRITNEHAGSIEHKVDVAVDTGSLVELAEGLREAARVTRGNEPAADPEKYV